MKKVKKKTIFLKKIIDELDLKVEICNQNIFHSQNTLVGDVIVARAFKPLNIILQLIHNHAKKWRKVFIYLGKTGSNELHNASKVWDIGYKQRVSVTSKDSLIIEINKLKKK